MFVIITLITCIISLLLGRKTIDILKQKGIGQVVRHEGPKKHWKKTGTPTMGGIFAILTVIIVYLGLYIFNVKVFTENIGTMLILLVFSLSFGFIGFLDDYLKIHKNNTDGLRPRYKMILLMIVSLIFVFLDKYHFSNAGLIAIPFTSIMVSVPLVVYFILCFLILISTTNAVNLTDGLDGLATSVGLSILTYFLVVAKMQSRYDIVLFILIIMGAFIGFLRYNWSKAKIFMGDTGSFFLGGVIALLAIALGKPLSLLFIAIVPVMETISVIIQVVYYHFKKKRFFKMAPFHHHLELSGYNEKKIVFMFTIITLVMAVLLVVFEYLV